MNKKLKKIVSGRVYIETPSGYVFVSCFDAGTSYSFYDVYDWDGEYLGEVSQAEVDEHYLDDDEDCNPIYNMDGLDELAESL